MLVQLLLAGLAATSSAAKVGNCAYDSCFFSSTLPSQYRPVVTKYCQYVIGRPAGTTTVTTTKLSTVTSSSTTTSTRTLIIDLLPVTTTVTSTETTTVVIVSTSTVTSTAAPSTVRVNAATFVDSDPRRPASVTGRAVEHVPRNVLSLPACLISGCRDQQPPFSKIKSACSCFLPYTTVTSTITGTITVIGAPSTVFTDITLRPPPPTFTTTVVTTTTVTRSTVSTTTVARKLAARTVTEITRCGTDFHEMPTATLTGALTSAGASSSSSSSIPSAHLGNTTQDQNRNQDQNSSNQTSRVYPQYGVATAGNGFIRVQITTGRHDDNETPLSEMLIAGVVTDAHGYADIPIPSVPGCYQYQIGLGGDDLIHSGNSNGNPSNTFHLSVFEQFQV